MHIKKLLKDNPSFHAWNDGSSANFGVSDSVIEYIYSKLKNGLNTLETGSGKSTVPFLLAGCKHISISPDKAEEIKIRKYCEDNNLESDFTFIAESSSTALPKLIEKVEYLDFVLIDGAHRYPFAEIDYHFAEKKLAIGGYMVIDDIQLPSVRNLFLFLRKEKNWKLDTILGKTAFFIKISNEHVINDWQNQGINQFYLHYSSFKYKCKKMLVNMFRLRE